MICLHFAEPWPCILSRVLVQRPHPASKFEMYIREPIAQASPTTQRKAKLTSHINHMPSPEDPGTRSRHRDGRPSPRSRDHTRRPLVASKDVDSSEDWTEIYVPKRAAANGGRDVPHKSHRRGNSYDSAVEYGRRASRDLPPLPAQRGTDSSSSSISRRASRDLPPIPRQRSHVDDSNGSSDSNYQQQAHMRASSRTKRPAGPPSAFETRDPGLARSRTTAGTVGRNDSDINRPRLAPRAQTANQAKQLPRLPVNGKEEKKRRPAQVPKPLPLITADANMSYPQRSYPIQDEEALWSEDTSDDAHNWVAHSTPALLHRRTDSSSTTSSGDSKSSSSSSSRSGFMKGLRMQQFIKILNVPINVDAKEASRRAPKTPASAKGDMTTPRSTSMSSFFRQSVEAPSSNQPHVNFRLRETTTTLLTHYNAFRSSIVQSSGTVCGDLQVQAREYQKIMEDYLEQFSILPDYCRELPHVKRLREQLEQTIAILEPVVAESGGEQALVYLDGTMVISKALLKSAHEILLNHKSSISRAPSIDEDSDVEYEVASPVVTNLIGKADGLESPRSLRRMRSSMAAMSPGPPSASPETPRAHAYGKQARRPLVLKDARNAQKFSQLLNLDAFSESLKVLKDVGLSSKDRRVKQDKPDDTRDITYGQDGIPIAMSREAIIKELIQEQSKAVVDKPGDGLIDIVFTNFRFWWTPAELLELLRIQYRASQSASKRSAILHLVRRWILSYWMSSDRVIITSLRQFLGKAMTDQVISTSVVLVLVERLQHYFEKGGNAVERANATWEVEKMPFRIADVARDMPLTRGAYDSVRLLQFNDHESCEEFARQLTLKESALYLDLSSTEVVRCFVEPGADRTAEAKLKRQREFSTKLKHWTTYSVLTEKDPVKRAKMFGFLARVANVCIRLRNFSSAHSIYNGLESVHIDSLPLTKAELTQKGKRLFDTVFQFFVENKEVSMQITALPTVPLMGIYAGKLQRLKEIKTSMYTPSKVDDSVDLINISLFRGATRVIFAMECNQIPYSFKAHVPVQDYLDYLLIPVPSDDVLHQIFRELKQSELEEPKPNPSFVSRIRSGSLSMGARPRVDH